jgi:hypothetical protein
MAVQILPCGDAGSWPADPLNPHVNAADNGNSFIYAKDPAIYQVLPNQLQSVQTTSTPTLSSYIFPKVGFDRRYVEHQIHRRRDGDLRSGKLI